MIGVVHTTEDRTVAAGHSVEVDPARWQGLFEEVMGRVAGRFPRVEPRRHARALVLGLLADLPRKNCWTIAEHAGQATPDGLQHLLSAAVWDHDAVRDDVRGLLVEHLGDPGAVLVVDETGDLKKGASTVGVQPVHRHRRQGRQRSGRRLPGLCHYGRARRNRPRAVPAPGWLADAERCRAAGVPTPRAFATKPELARVMLERVLDAEVPAGWVTADEADGGSPALRSWLETRQLPYVLAVKRTEPLATLSGPRVPAARLAEGVPPACWLRISAGQGAKGRRWYAWSRLPLAAIGAPQGGGRVGCCCAAA
jgi:SRSO17 transposase